MPRQWICWARRASVTALAAIIGTAAIAGDKPSVTLKRGPTYKAKATARAQNSDDEVFDSMLIDKPRFLQANQSSDWCVPHTTPCEPNGQSVPLPPQMTSPLTPDPNQPSPQTMNNQAVEGMDFGGGLAALGPAGRAPSMMGDFFGGGSISLSTPGLISPTPIAWITTEPVGPTVTGQIVSFNVAPGDLGGSVPVPATTYVGTVPLAVLENHNPAPDQEGFSFALGPNTSSAWLLAVKAALLEQELLAPGSPLIVNGQLVLVPVVLPSDLVVQKDGTANQINTDSSSSDGTVTPGNDEFSLLQPIHRIPMMKLQVPAGALSGVLKLAENGSPIPRDRLFINYNLYTNTALTANGVNVNRLSPGFEKTFFNGQSSFELRMPFATTLDSDITNADLGTYSTGKVEFGNVMTTWKSYLYNDGVTALTGGLGMTFPTADDVSIRLSTGTEALRFQNNAVHAMPFVGGLYTPNSRMFVQSILQVDVPTNGQGTYYNLDVNNVYGKSSLSRVGVYTPPTYLYFDTAAGYWMYNNDSPGAWLSGVAGMIELHYNTTLNKTDSIAVGIPSGSGPIPIGFAQIGDRNYIDMVNILVGSTIEFRRSANLQLGYATPIGGDHVFDGELRCNFNYYFGRNLYGRSYRAGGI